MRYALKKDLNDRELVSLALQLGAAWYRYGPLDGWILWRGKFIPTEIKNINGRNRYTPIQEAFIEHCRREGVLCFTWRTVDDVLASLNSQGVTHAAP